MKVEIISYTKNPIETIAVAASTCYNSEPNNRVVKNCIESGHTSVLEMASFCFKITGVSRALLAQLTRHRIASFAVQSQRYVNCEENEFIMPPVKNENSKEIINKVYFDIKDSYSSLIECGEKKENTRAILPNACETTIVASFNLRSLGNFMNERLCSKAQLEIRQLALAIKKAILEVIDDVEMRDFLDKRWLVPKCEKYAIAFCTEKNTCKKHPKLEDLVK